jgi:transposase
MWQAFETSVENNLPSAEIVRDRFDISKYLKEAVDKVRRDEHKPLKADEGDAKPAFIQPGEPQRRKERRTFRHSEIDFEDISSVVSSGVVSALLGGERYRGWSSIFRELVFTSDPVSA